MNKFTVTVKKRHTSRSNLGYCEVILRVHTYKLMIQPSEQLWTVMYTKGVRRLINSLWKMFWIYLGYYMMTIYSAQYISFPVILIFRRMKIYKYQQIWGGGGRVGQGVLVLMNRGVLGLGLGGGGSLFYVLMFIIKCELLPKNSM